LEDNGIGMGSFSFEKTWLIVFMLYNANKKFEFLNTFFIFGVKLSIWGSFTNTGLVGCVGLSPVLVLVF
jgi:hypothetical protein